MPTTRSQRPKLAQPHPPTTRAKKCTSQGDQGSREPDRPSDQGSADELQENRASGDHLKRFDGVGTSPAILGRYPETPYTRRGRGPNNYSPRTDQRYTSPQPPRENRDSSEGTRDPQESIQQGTRPSNQENSPTPGARKPEEPPKVDPEQRNRGVCRQVEPMGSEKSSVPSNQQESRRQEKVQYLRPHEIQQSGLMGRGGQDSPSSEGSIRPHPPPPGEQVDFSLFLATINHNLNMVDVNTKFYSKHALQKIDKRADEIKKGR